MEAIFFSVRESGDKVGFRRAEDKGTERAQLL